MRRAVLYCTYYIALYYSLTVVRDAINLLRRVALTFGFFLSRFSPLLARMRRAARTLQSTKRMHVSIYSCTGITFCPMPMCLPLLYKLVLTKRKAGRRRIRSVRIVSVATRGGDPIPPLFNLPHFPGLTRTFFAQSRDANSNLQPFLIPLFLHSHFYSSRKSPEFNYIEPGILIPASELQNL